MIGRKNIENVIKNIRLKKINKLFIKKKYYIDNSLTRLKNNKKN